VVPKKTWVLETFDPISTATIIIMIMIMLMIMIMIVLMIMIMIMTMIMVMIITLSVKSSRTLQNIRRKVNNVKSQEKLIMSNAYKGASYHML